MPPTKAEIAAVRAATEAPHATAVRTKLQRHDRTAVAPAALAIWPEPDKARTRRLFELVSLKGPADRLAKLAAILEDLRRELPGVLSRLPLRPTHFGFSQTEDLVQFLGQALATMRTSARSAAEFAAGIGGWRWNLAGRVLFERLVKHHPQLRRFLRRWAGEFVTSLNHAAGQRRGLLDLHGSATAVRSPFGKPTRVEHFVLVGADGVEREFTDFGFIASNREGRVALLPIEIKQPAALARVAGQFGGFVPRLREAQQLIAVVEEGGTARRVKIAPSALVFLQHDRAQIAVAPLSARRAAELLGPGRAVDPSSVATVADLDQGVSPTHAAIYYRVRLLVARDWLESIVRLITDPP